MADPGDLVAMRYHHGANDGPVQAVLPMLCVQDDGEMFVGWTPPLTQIRYWATAAGGDPREIPMGQRFVRPHVSAPRVWQGGGVLRVIPRSEPFQVIHFWGPDGFRGWYVNLEARKTDRGRFLDSVDWHLDLLISPELVPSWKDEDEAEAAFQAGQLGREELDLARTTGEAVIAELADWPERIGDWRHFPQPELEPLTLPVDWEEV